MKILRLHRHDADFDTHLSERLMRHNEPAPEISEQVGAIIRDIRARGDRALLEYTHRFDRRRVGAGGLEISADRMEAALAAISAEMRRELEYAAKRISDYHQRQVTESWSYRDDTGTTLGQRITPIERVGVYVPGGKAAYPSSVLMNVIPAVVAGVSEIIMVVPAPDDRFNPLVLAAAKITGVTRGFAIGGAQAVAALAYGTETVPRVDKIVGPGNIYVATAKRMVFGRVGIDMIAGPSEVLIVCDSDTNPDWAVADMLAQAEHDEQASALLISTSGEFLDAVQTRIEALPSTLERADIIEQSLSRNGLLIQVEDLAEAAKLVNRIAPEHLQLSLRDPAAFVDRVRHAGAIFIGQYSAEALGDYCAGPNHVLPTAGTARFSSPLGVYDFQKRSSLIMCTQTSAAGLANTATILARGEGLSAHARSAELRMKDAK